MERFEIESREQSSALLLAVEKRSPVNEPNNNPQVESVERGNRVSTNELFALVYNELRRLASKSMNEERPGHTLQATALVNEAYLRLVRESAEPQWDGRTHFFAAAAVAMRRILVDSARKRGSIKRGNNWTRIDLDPNEHGVPQTPVDILALDEALKLLSTHDPKNAELVELRYFAGLKIEDVADVLGISVASAVRSWRYSRAWLADKLDVNDDM